jgi:hypothetical protein
MPLNTRKINFKNIFLKNIFLGNYKSSTYVSICQGGCTFVLEKVSAKGTRCGQDQCSYTSKRLPQVSWPTSTTRMAVN